MEGCEEAGKGVVGRGNWVNLCRVVRLFRVFGKCSVYSYGLGLCVRGKERGVGRWIWGDCGGRRGGEGRLDTVKVLRVCVFGRCKVFMVLVG